MADRVVREVAATAAQTVPAWTMAPSNSPWCGVEARCLSLDCHRCSVEAQALALVTHYHGE